MEWDGWNAAPFAQGQASWGQRRFHARCAHFALDLAQRGVVDAVCFAPLNKSALARRRHETGGRAALVRRCSSAIAGRAENSTCSKALDLARDFAHSAQGRRGTAHRRGRGRGDRHAATTRPPCGQPPLRASAYAASIPHNGDNGNFGREEIDIIAPGIALAARRGYTAAGPYPADTIFVRARDGAFDGIVTMYHDQGQIAMKLMGFGARRHGARRPAGRDHDAGARHRLRHRRDAASPTCRR